MPKRRNFTAIQNSAGIATDGYAPNPVCSGMESVVSHRTGSKFATMSKGDGVVTEVTADAVAIEYDDPTLGVERAPLGLQRGIIAGLRIPHTLVTDLKVNQRIPSGHALSYNPRFFVADPLVPGQLLYKWARLVRTVLIETPDTLEDSSAISEALADTLRTPVTYPQTVLLSPGEVIHGLVDLHAHVNIGDILCTIENPITANAGLFDEESYSSLAELAKGAVRSKVAGDVDEFEVYYNGDPDDFDDMAARLIRLGDARRAERKRNMGGEGADTGRVDTSNTIHKMVLQPGQLLLVINISTAYPTGVGDKGVISYQLKTTIGRVLNGVNTTEDGQPIDYFYGYTGVSDRIVDSAGSVGLTNTLCLELTKRVIGAYRGK